MMKKLGFIGRDKELSEIERLVSYENKNSIVFLEADGGIGKTTMLRKIEEIYSERENIIVSKIIDYDNYFMFNLDIIKDEILTQIKNEDAKRYRELSDALESIKAKLSKKLLNQEFSRYFNEVSENKKFILLIDTAEKITEKTFWYDFVDFIKNFKNVLVILSGRNKMHDGEPINRMQTYFEDKIDNNIFILKTIELDNFSAHESEIYFNSKIKSLKLNEISEKVIKCIHMLTNGNPIVLDLTIEWVIKSPFINEPDKLFQSLGLVNCDVLAKHDPIILYQKQEEIITDVENLKSNIVKLIHALLYIPKITLDMIGYIDNNIKKEDFEELKSYVFIKNLDIGYITLHDEMERLLQEFIIPKIDLDGQLKKQYSKKIIPFYNQEQDTLKEKLEFSTSQQEQFKISKELEFNTIELLRHLFIVDENLDNAMKTLQNIFNQERDKANYIFIKKIIQKIENIIDFEKLSLDNQISFIRIKAKSLSMEGKNFDGEKLLIHFETENKEKLNELRLARIRNMLAGIYSSMGKLADAQITQEYAYDIFKSNNDDLQLYSGNHLGIVHTRIGNFDTAIKYFENILSEIGDDPIFKGIVFNHLATAYRQKGEFDEALENVELAIDFLSEDIRANKKLAVAYTTLANIYRDNIDYLNAEIFYAKAEKALNINEDIEPYLDLQINKSKLYWFKYQTSKQPTLEDIHDALSLITEVKEIASENKFNIYYLELIKVYSIISNLYWILEDKDKARESLEICYELSKGHGNIYYQVVSLLQFAEFDYEEKVEDLRDKIFKYAEMLEKYESKYSFPHFFGRMKIYKAKVLFDNKEYSEAKKYYRNGFVELYKHDIRTVVSMQDELKDLSKKLTLIHNSQITKEYFDYFQSELKKYPRLLKKFERARLGIK